MFNRETEYALRSLVYIKLQNNKGRRPGSVEISREIGASHFYVAKILQRVAREGFIESVKGKGGGFYFNPDKPDLTLKDLIKFIEGDRSFSGCGFGLKECDENNPCPFHDKYAPIRESLDNLLSEETVQSLANSIRS